MNRCGMDCLRMQFSSSIFRFALLVLTYSHSAIMVGQELDTNFVPEAFRSYVHLLDAAVVVVPEAGPNWRDMDIKDYDDSRKKYQELETMVLKVWPRVQLLTAMMDTLRPVFLAGIDAVPKDTLMAQRREIKEGQQKAKAERKAERKGRKSAENNPLDEDEPKLEDESELMLIGEAKDVPDTLFMPDDDCMLALKELNGFLRADSVDDRGYRMLVEDTTFQDVLGLKEGLLLVHLLDRQNPGMLDFVDDYAKAVKLPFWGTIKMFSRLTGYRVSRAYNPEGADGRIEHIIRKHGLDLLDLPCAQQ